MAIWQYQLTVIPKQSVLGKFGKIPNKLEVNEEAWEKYWENVIDIENLPEPNFEDANTINWWKNSKIKKSELVENIDKLVKRAEWSKDSLESISWKGNENLKEDNDCFIAFNKYSKVIGEFSFRVDLRKKRNIENFLTGMLEICEKNELIVYNNEGILFLPKLELIIGDLKNSKAVDFLTNPGKFIEKIAKKENKSKIEKTNFWKKLKQFWN